jgi:hypothetical protein
LNSGKRIAIADWELALDEVGVETGTQQQMGKTGRSRDNSLERTDEFNVVCEGSHDREGREFRLKRDQDRVDSKGEVKGREGVALLRAFTGGDPTERLGVRTEHT